ncbi:HlyD family efflux transporter periplasmic adaptor subunit [Chakrabartyella piscis]|uniref:HlyD family efflux transporter periplasmic adaptor subunit n=1 Tax=Chakrabartyella piscis TaxID=2918914 RepID=UPI0029589EE2|nr:HlyD family efflux transporter periplasmic adaptor subunit [Chakrabartyella piscis]
MERKNSSNNRKKTVPNSRIQERPPRKNLQSGKKSPPRPPRTQMPNQKNGAPRKNPQQRMQQPQPKKQREVPHVVDARLVERRKRANAIVPMFVFITIVVYLCGQMFNLLVEREEVDIETVQIGTLDTPERYTGLIIRNESLVYSDREGQVFYEYSEGDAIAKNTYICSVKDVGETDDLEEKIYEIDQDILEQQKLRADLSLFAEDITRLESNIDRSIASYDGNVMDNGVSYVYDMKDEISGYMSQRDAIWLSESIDSFASMSAEKNEYEQQLSENMSTFYAPESGILAFTYDGLEESLNSDALATLTESQVASYENSFLAKTQLVEEGDVLFRIVEENKWYIVVYVPNAMAASWSTGNTKNLYLTLDDNIIDILGKVDSLTVGDTQTKVVFSTYQRMTDFMDQRVVRFYFEAETISGLKVPNDAIVEKTLLSIPENCLAESGSARGVFVDDGAEGRFVSMNVLTYVDGFYYVEPSDAVTLGTRILYKEDDIFDSNNIYTISQLESLSGVYLVNSSMAEFVSIEILDQNQEYAIIKSGSIYGLQSYDNIVANAKNIQEGQSVY